MSAHETDSELGQLNRSAGTGAMRLSRDVRIVLDRALFWARHSDGLFDPVAAGHAAVTRGDIPLHGGQPAPDPAADYHALVLDDMARLTRPACVDLGGIAKGHAVDTAIAALREAGMTDGIVNAGGDLFAFGRPRRVDVSDPANGTARLTFTLRDRALATSAAQRVDALTKIAFARHPRLAHLLALADAQAVAITRSGDVTDLGSERLAA